MKSFTPIFCVLLLSACDTRTCTDIGCQDQVEVRFGAEDGRATGTYVVVVQAEEFSTECQVTVGNGGLGVGGQGGAIGQGGAAEPNGGGGSDSLEFECLSNLPGLSVEVLGTERLEGILIYDAWEEISIQVTRGDELLLNESFEPDYTELAPNGEDCPPVCSVATHEGSFAATE